MPFSSQPRKKGTSKPQAEATPSCGHSPGKKDCPACLAKIKKTTLVDVAAEKAAIAGLQNKITDKIRRDPKGADKASFVLSLWINQKRK